MMMGMNGYFKTPLNVDQLRGILQDTVTLLGEVQFFSADTDCRRWRHAKKIETALKWVSAGDCMGVGAMGRRNEENQMQMFLLAMPTFQLPFHLSVRVEVNEDRVLDAERLFDRIVVGAQCQYAFALTANTPNRLAEELDFQGMPLDDPTCVERKPQGYFDGLQKLQRDFGKVVPQLYPINYLSDELLAVVENTLGDAMEPGKWAKTRLGDVTRMAFTDLLNAADFVPLQDRTRKMFWDKYGVKMVEPPPARIVPRPQLDVAELTRLLSAAPKETSLMIGMSAYFKPPLDVTHWREILQNMTSLLGDLNFLGLTRSSATTMLFQRNEAVLEWMSRGDCLMLAAVAKQNEKNQMLLYLWDGSNLVHCPFSITFQAQIDESRLAEAQACFDRIVTGANCLYAFGQIGDGLYALSHELAFRCSPCEGEWHIEARLREYVETHFKLRSPCATLPPPLYPINYLPDELLTELESTLGDGMEPDKWTRTRLGDVTKVTFTDLLNRAEFAPLEDRIRQRLWDKYSLGRCEHPYDPVIPRVRPKATKPEKPKPTPGAREWLKANTNPNGFASNRFDSLAKAVKFVESLYAAGATTVLVDGICDEPERLKDEGGPYADTLLVSLPEDQTARSAIFKIHKRESKREGFDPTPDAGQTELTFWWD